ncbi:MAG: aldo/keto reductase [Erysipelotrichaceae bacterium]
MEPVKLSSVLHGHWRLKEWNLSTEQLTALVEQCIDAGVTSFDHADIYGGYTCEEMFGRVLAAEPELRSKIQLITKCGIKLVHPNREDNTLHCYDTTRKHILASVETSLKNFQTDYLDVLLIHRLDYLMDYQEVADTFVELYRSGSVRAFGVSNFLPAQIEALQHFLPFPLQFHQIECSPLCLDAFYNGTLELAQRMGMQVMIYSPLGGGRLFSHDEPHIVAALERVKNEMSLETIDEVVYAWLAKHPANLKPIVGSGKWERIARACTGVKQSMSNEQWYDIFVAAQGYDIP